MLRAFLGFIMALWAWEGVKPTPMSLNDDVLIHVSADAPAVLRFDGQAGQGVRIVAQAIDAQALDTTLRLIAPDGRQIAYHDDVFFNGELVRDASVAIVLPQNGAYTLIVDSFDGLQVGDVRVSVTSYDAFARQETGASVRATLPKGETLRLEQHLMGDVTLTVRGGGMLDPILRVLDAEGQWLAEADDQQGAPDLHTLDVVMRLEALPSGVYTLLITDFLGRGGAIELTIDQDNP